MKVGLITALLGCSSFLASNSAIAAGPGAHPGSSAEGEVLRKLARGFRVQGAPLVDDLIQLGKAAGQPIGIEYVDLQSLEKPTSFSIDHATLGEGLRLVLAGRKGHAWRVEDGVLVITNSSVPKGRANLLDRVLPAFSIPKCTLQEASHQLDMALSQELTHATGSVGDYNPGLNGPMVGPMKMTNATVRQALNRLVREAGQAAWVVQVFPKEMAQRPPRGFWLVVEYNDGQTMGRVGQLILGGMYPVGSPPPYANPSDKP